MAWTLAGLAGLLVVLVAGAWFWRLPLAEWLALRALERAGLETAELHVEELAPGRIVVRGVLLGGESGWQVGRIEVVPDLTQLTAPRASRLVLSDVVARAAYGPDGLDLGALNPLLAPGTGGKAAPPPLDDVVVERARLFLDTPYGPLELDLDGVADLNAVTARAQFTLRGQGEEATGTLDLSREAEALVLNADLASGADQAAVVARLDPGSLRPLRVQAQAELKDVARLALFLPGLAGLSGGANLAADYAPGGPWRAQLDLAGLTVPGTVRDLSGNLVARAEAAALDTGIVPLTARMKATRVALAGTVMDRPDIALDGTVTLDPAALAPMAGRTAAATANPVPLRAAQAKLSLTATQLASGTLRGRTARLDLDLGTTGAWPGIDVAITGGRLSFASLELGTQARTTQAVRFDLGPAKQAPVRSPDDLLAVGFTVSAAPVGLEVSGHHVRLGLPPLAASATFGASLGLHVAGCCGTIGLAKPKVEATGLDLTLASAADKLLTARFRLKTLSTPWTVALAADGNFNMDGPALRFDGTVTAPGGILATAAGTHDLDKGEGQFDADVPRLTFAPDGLQPGQLAPPLAPLVAQVAGTVAGHATLRWTPRSTSSNAHVLVEDLSLAVAEVPAAHINTVVAFDSLLPPTTPPGQKVAIGGITMGVPLTDGVVTFRLVPGAIAVESATLGLAGGRVALAPTRIELPIGAETLTLSVSGVMLDALLKVAGVEGLSGEGVLDGTIPVEIADHALRIPDGRLAAREAGVLRYTPQTYPSALQGDDERIQLLVRALRDFRYDRLGLGINREKDGEALLALSLAGRNPAVLDGYPFELNLNLSGRLDQIVTEGLAGYRMPDDIRRRMQQFGNRE